MSLVAGTLINTAIQRAYAWVGSQKVSKPALLAELSFQDQQVVQMIAQSNPDMFASATGVVTLSAAGNSAGYTLSQGIHYRDFVHADSTDGVYTPITLVQRQQRDLRPQPPAAMLRTGASAGVFYPIDPLNKRWGGSDTRIWYNADEGHTVTYSYIPLPAAVTSLTSTLTSPDMAREVFVSALESQLILSNPPKDEVALAAWQTRLQMAMKSYTEAFTSLRMQVHKFAAPEGTPSPDRSGWGDADWVADQIGD